MLLPVENLMKNLGGEIECAPSVFVFDRLFFFQPFLAECVPDERNVNRFYNGSGLPDKKRFRGVLFPVRCVRSALVKSHVAQTFIYFGIIQPVQNRVFLAFSVRTISNNENVISGFARG